MGAQLAGNWLTASQQLAAQLRIASLSPASRINSVALETRQNEPSRDVLLFLLWWLVSANLQKGPLRAPVTP